MYRDIMEQAIDLAIERFRYRDSLIASSEQVSIDELNQGYDAVIQSEDMEAAMMAFIQEYGKESWDRVLQNKATVQRRKESANDV